MTSPLRAPDAALAAALGQRSSSDTLPLLLEVARRQAARRAPADLLRQYVKDPFVRPSMLDLRLAQRLDTIALEASHAFEALLLSPVAPLGSCSTVSPTTQDRAVSTIRGSEVISDPTNVLALECARRLSAGAASPVRLCTVQQVLRPQKFEPRPGFSQHFRLLALAEAGSALPNHGFEVTTMASHAALFVDLFDRAASLGYTFSDRRARLLVASHRTAIGDRLAALLAETLPGVPVERGELDSTYYDGVRLLVGARTSAGDLVELGDVGLFDWVAKLTSNRRLRLVASGLGIQLFPLLFATTSSTP
jgi:hypothetical protein